MDGFRIKISQGRPITRPTIIVADAAYDSNEIRKNKNQEDLKSSIKKFTREEVQLKDFSVG